MANKKRENYETMFPYIVGRKTFTRMVDLIEWSGLSNSTLRRRILEGLDPKEVVRDNTKTYKFDGKTYTTILALSKYCGVGYGSLATRISKKGWSVYKAVTTPVIKRPAPIHRKFRVGGVALNGIAELARFTGISESTLYQRISIRNMSTRKAIETPVKRQSKSGPVEAFGVIYKNLVEVAKAHGKLLRGSSTQI